MPGKMPKKPMPRRMPTPGESIASGNRMSKMNAADMKAVKKTAPMKMKAGGRACKKKGY